MKWRLLAALIGPLILGGCAKGPAAGDATTVLRYATPYTASHPLSLADKAWISHIEAASGGRLRIEPSYAGGLISSEHNLIELRHGVADIATISPIYTRGGTHAIRLQAGFYGGERSIDDQVAVYRCLQASTPQLDAELQGLVPLAIQGGNVLGLVTRTRPVRRLEDMRGLRIRAPGELVPLLRRLGADPLDMPMADVYPAMAKGVIDGVVAPADTLKALHFAEVARYYNQLRFARGAYPARAIAAASLSRLPPELQGLITGSRLFWERAVASEFKRAEQTGIAYARGLGVIFVAPEPSAQERLDSLYLEEAAIAARASHDLAGPTMLRTAQQTIAQLRNGVRPPCAGAPL